MALCAPQMEARKRHIDDHQGVPHGPAHHLGVVNHLLKRHRQRRAVSLDDHRKAVADQNPLDAGRIDQAGQGVIVGGEHRDLVARRLHGGELGNRNLLGVVHGREKQLNFEVETYLSILNGAALRQQCARRTKTRPKGIVRPFRSARAAFLSRSERRQSTPYPL